MPIRRLVLMALALLTSLPLFAGTASAGVPPLQVTGDLAPGGAVRVQSAQCQGRDLEDQPVPGTVSVSIVGGEPFSAVAELEVATDLEGAWSADLVIAADAQPGGTYIVIAECSQLNGAVPSFFDYPDFTFTMGQASTSTTTTPVTDEPVPDTVAPTPAPSVRARPAFTG